MLGNDITTPVAINEFEAAGFQKVFDKSRIALVMDHFAPNKDIKAATQCKQCRTFARKFDIDNYYDVGEMGIEHALLPEKGLVAPGEAVIGADSHTCTYGALGAFSTGVGSTDMGAAMAVGQTWFKVPSAIRVVVTGKKKPFVSGKDVILTLIGRIGVDGALYQSLEFCGDGIGELTIYDRLTISNMAIEAGAKNGIFPVDDVTRAYVAGRVSRPWTAVEADPDAEYTRTIELNLDEIDCTVAWPHLPENAHSARDGADVAIDQVVIGSCTNGQIDDMAAAAAVLKGHHLAPGVRDHHPRDAERLPRVHAPRLYGHLPRRGLHRLHADLRAVSRRPHGHSRRGRALRLHHQPQLRGPHGSRHQRGLSRLARRGRGIRHRGPHLPS